VAAGAVVALEEVLVPIGGPVFHRTVGIRFSIVARLLAEERCHLILFLLHLRLRDEESGATTGSPQLGHRLADQRVGDGLNPTRMPLLAMLSHFA
jgi:hypothetical protein